MDRLLRSDVKPLLFGVRLGMRPIINTCTILFMDAIEAVVVRKIIRVG